MTVGGGGGAGNSVSSWLELESDPGLFTLLIDDFGVKGVQVEEIYDLSKPLENSIFGFIFLFKWIERRSRRSKVTSLEPHSNYVTDPNIVNKMFFAHQIVPNSCATHALLSILLNCKANKYLDLGELLSKFQRICEGLTPESKGYAIGNQPKLAQVHNYYAKPEGNKQNAGATSSRFGRFASDSCYASSSSTASSSLGSSTSLSSFNFLSTAANSLGIASASAASNPHEIFHFICFIPINGRLYELDGLKPFPVDHGPLQTDNDPQSSNSPSAKSTFNWTNKFKQIIRQRLASFNNGQQNHEIRFNLMAVVPDKMLILNRQMELMRDNRNSLCAAINQTASGESETSGIIKTELITNPLESSRFTEQQQQQQQTEQKADIVIKKEAGEIAESGCTRSTRQSQRQKSASQLNHCAGKEDLSSLVKVDHQATFQFELVFVLSGEDLEMACFANENEQLAKELASLRKRLMAQSNGLFDLVKQYKLEAVRYLGGRKEELEEPSLSRASSEINTSVLVRKFTDLTQIKSIESKLQQEIESDETKFNEEIERRKKYKIDALRRKHVYDEFIVTYLKILNENGKLAEIIKNNGVVPGNNATSGQTNSTTNGSAFSSIGSIYLQQPLTKKIRKK